MMISEILVVFITSFLVIKYFFTKLSKQPGGPWKLPILGHLPFFGFYPHKTIMGWAGKYGPIFPVQFGSFPAIVLNDTASIKSALNQPSFSGRPKIKFLDEMGMNRSGIVWSDGPVAKEIRQFAQRKLKESGYGGRRMEAQIQEHVPKLLEIFESHLGRKLEVNHIFSHITLEYMWEVIAGKNGDRDEKEFQKFAKNLMLLPKAPPLLALSILIPKLLSWFPNLTGYNERLKVIEEVHEYIKNTVTAHEENHKVNDPRDLIDNFLDQEKISPDVFTRTALHITVFELLAGGTDTSSATLEWVIFYLVKHPEIQDKLAREIQEKIPNNQEPRISDRSNMPYCDAILNETLRVSSIFPLAIFHSALEDTEFQGFLFQKDTMVVANTYAAHYDPSIWEDPAEFKPERFLGKDGKLNDEVSKVLAFGTGKRKCIGETLGRNQIFLFVVNLFRRYKLKPWGKLPPGRVNTMGFIQTCETFFVDVSPRS